jgi:signal transduction histidine kinase/CheY-like chemotaxis protein
MKWPAVWLLLLCAVWMTGSVRADALDVAQGQPQSAQAGLVWCQTSPAVTIETIVGEGCAWQPLAGAATGRGFSRDAFWMRLELDNASERPVERWIRVGHPRLAEVSLYSSSADGWVREDVGNRTPMVARGAVEREFGVLPITAPPHSRQTLWLRVFSDTAIDLSATVWAPANYVHAFQKNQFWITLGLGGALITILFALLMFGLTRQPAYLYFSLGLGGPLANVAVSTGVLQRSLWQETWPLPSVLIAVSALVGVLGYYGFMRAFLPHGSRYRRTNLSFKGSVLVTVVALLYAITVDYAAAAMISGVALAITIASATLVTFLAWRDGDRTAGILLIAFTIYLSLVLLRLGLSIGHVGWFPESSLLGTWGLVLSAPVMLLGLVDRTRELLAELNRVQADNDTQLAFLAQMSHELRSPLDTILGNAQMLARTRQNPTVTERLATIFESSRNLLRMIDHILDYSRGLAGGIKITPSPMGLDPFLRGIERSARLLAARQGNRFHLRRGRSGHDGQGLVLLLDADPLRRVLNNLITNSARHTHNGTITLDLAISPASPDELRLDFSVTDTGEGIEPGDLQRIFTPFERVRHGKGQDGKGAGLGLTIARQLTELMGGTLTVESEPGHGACFRFWVLARTLQPEVNAPPETPEGFEAEGYLGRRQSVLVVDDNEGNRTLLVGLLEELGFQVIQAESGQAVALRLKSMATLDLVITDQFMDDGDGWMVLQAVQAEWPEVPVLLVSAAPPSPPLKYPPHLRFSAHFLRPLDHEQLLLRVGDLLGLTWSATPSRAHRDDDAEYEPNTDGLSSNTKGADASETMAFPGDADARVLARLVETGQVTAIKEWATALKAREPHCTVFAERVLATTQSLDMEMLRELAEQAGPTLDT